MNKISGREQPTEDSAYVTTKRNVSADAQPTRDVETDGRRLADLLHGRARDQQRSDVPEHAQTSDSDQSGNDKSSQSKNPDRLYSHMSLHGRAQQQNVAKPSASGSATQRDTAATLAERYSEQTSRPIQQRPTGASKAPDSAKLVAQTQGQAASSPVRDAKQGAKQGLKEERNSQDPTTDAPRTTGDQILQGLMARGTADQQALADPPSAAANHIDALADRLAQRILVSDRSLNTDSAVRIQLRDSVLGGAEITIERAQGQLNVAFNVADSAVGQYLHANVDDLQRQLGDKIKEPVSVQVNIGGGNTSGGGSDGRSRNQRDLEAEWQHDENS